MKRPELKLLLMMLTLSGLTAEAFASTWYPSSIDPYPGTTYRCEVRPLPHSMRGIPATDLEYIDHAFSVILKCTQEKELMMKAINDRNAFGGLDRYKTVIQSQFTRLDGLDTPRGLEQFQEDLVAALKLQETFFEKAATASYNGEEMKQIMAIPEAREASNRLISAWSIMETRYPTCDSASKDSLYHHICALDLF
jgi:hypothetical protein